MSFIEKIIETITNPKNAMKSIAEEPMIEEAVMIVGIIAILSALTTYLTFDKIMPVAQNMPGSFQSMFTTFLIVGALIFPFIGWIIGTGIIHIIAMLLGGEGKFYPQLITAAGYSMIPQIFGIIISLALFFAIGPTTAVDITNPASAKEALTSPYTIATNIIKIIMQIWAAVIFVFGVQNVHKLTLGKSAVAVGIPLIISIILAAFSLWSASTI